jgi:hypothetical protein
LGISQGILGNLEGAVLRRMTKPAGEDADWRILYKAGSKFVQVGKTRQRPKKDDLVRISLFLVLWMKFALVSACSNSPIPFLQL